MSSAPLPQILREARVLLLSVLLALSGFASGEARALRTPHGAVAAAGAADAICLHEADASAVPTAEAAPQPASPAGQDCPYQDHCTLCCGAFLPALAILPVQAAVAAGTLRTSILEPRRTGTGSPGRARRLPPNRGPPPNLIA